MLISATRDYVPLDDLETLFSHELCANTGALFDNIQLFHDAQRTMFVPDIQKVAQVDCKSCPVRGNTKYVFGRGIAISMISQVKG